MYNLVYNSLYLYFSANTLTFIHSTNICSIYSGSGTVLGVRDAVVNKTVLNIKKLTF